MAVQPSEWNRESLPPEGGSVSIRWTDTTTTFTASPNSGWRFSHWEFQPWSGSSMAPGQWMPALAAQLSTNLNNATHISGRYQYDPNVNPEYANAGIKGIAHFVKEEDFCTVTLVAHNGWGQVCFAGETPTTGVVSKSVQKGTIVTIEAIRTGYPEYVFWRTPSGDSFGNPSRTITATSDVTYTAFFGYWCHAHAAELSDPETRVPVGETEIVYTGGSSGWGPDISLYVFNGSEVTFNQRTSLVGWSFVKWRFRQGDSDWMEDTGQSLSNYSLATGGLYAIALFQRTPTHLLVNSSDFATPVRLTYDDRAGGTGLLVADY